MTKAMMAPADAALKTSCDHCSFCCNRPGWFAPGEAQRTAKALGIPWEDFRDRYLVIDSFHDDDMIIYGWCPAKTVTATGELVEPAGHLVSPTWQIPQLGQMCIFWKDFRCSINEVKPLECKEYECWNRDPAKSTALHGRLLRMWRRHQREFGRKVRIYYEEGGRRKVVTARKMPIELAQGAGAISQSDP